MEIICIYICNYNYLFVISEVSVPFPELATAKYHFVSAIVDIFSPDPHIPYLLRREKYYFQ